MSKDEALKMAIDVLQNYAQADSPVWRKALNACKEALEQPSQEPVAHFVFSGNVWSQVADEYKNEHFAVPLYIHPHQWQGLTDDEIAKLWKKFETELVGCDIRDWTRVVEQALKEKNT
jgi:hypothetical protein